MHLATINKDYEMLAFLAKQKGTDFNLADENLETPLFRTVELKDLELAKFLVEECSAEVEAIGKYGRTPTYYASTAGQADITKYFLSKGGNTNIQRTGGRNPLIKACVDMNIELIKVLLDQPDIDVNLATNASETALHTIILS